MEYKINFHAEESNNNADLNPEIQNMTFKLPDTIKMTRLNKVVKENAAWNRTLEKWVSVVRYTNRKTLSQTRAKKSRYYHSKDVIRDADGYIRLSRVRGTYSEPQGRKYFLKMTEEFNRITEGNYKKMTKSELLYQALDYAAKNNALLKLDDNRDRFSITKFADAGMIEPYLFSLICPKIFNYGERENTLIFEDERTQETFKEIFDFEQELFNAIIYDAILKAVELSANKCIPKKHDAMHWHWPEKMSISQAVQEHFDTPVKCSCTVKKQATENNR